MKDQLVTNSLKRAFPDGRGNIAVSLDLTEDGEVALVVCDDGRGRSASQLPSGPGLGTSIINGLVKQRQGKTMTESQQGARTEIRVAAPVLS